MKNNIKTAILLLSKYIGFFALCKILYRNRIRILCYHGFSLKNEEEFVPGLFIKPDIFHRRMNYIKDQNFNVISLDDAFKAVSTNNIKENSLVITIDDGLYSVYKKALPILKKFEFPSTLYLTSYYFDKDMPVFNLAVKYMFFNSEQTNADLSSLGIIELSSLTDLKLKSKEATKCLEIIVKTGQSYEHDHQRIDLLEKIGKILDQNYNLINESRILNLVTRQELKECEEGKMNIELHTHRHNFPTNVDIAKYEIEKNKSRINPLLNKPMSHFCYPSGEWNKDHWPILMSQDIKTSTTCENGLVTAKTPLHAWSRFLDSARVSQLEFEAELSGFNELLRKFRLG